jgi:Fe-S-cluster formation regulator IscX/YfhJ
MFNRHSCIVSLNNSHTNKSHHVVQTFESTADAHGIYACLWQAYEEDLSNSLSATDLRSEVTLLRFDDKRKKSNEAFLLSWKSKILELEQLEDKRLKMQPDNSG